MLEILATDRPTLTRLCECLPNFTRALAWPTSRCPSRTSIPADRATSVYGAWCRTYIDCPGRVKDRSQRLILHDHSRSTGGFDTIRNRAAEVQTCEFVATSLPLTSQDDDVESGDLRHAYPIPDSGDPATPH